MHYFTDKHGHDTETERAALLAQAQRRMAVMYELKNRCFPIIDRLKWFHPTLEEHITKEPHLYQQQAWLETYELMIRHRIHDRDRVTQQRALPTSRGTPKPTTRPGNFLLYFISLGFSTDLQVRT
jgi:hypothetical protein